MLYHNILCYIILCACMNCEGRCPDRAPLTGKSATCKNKIRKIANSDLQRSKINIYIYIYVYIYVNICIYIHIHLHIHIQILKYETSEFQTTVNYGIITVILFFRNCLKTRHSSNLFVIFCSLDSVFLVFL